MKFFSSRSLMAIVDSTLIKNFSIRIEDKSVRCFQSAELVSDGCPWILKDRETKLRCPKVLTVFFGRLILVGVNSDETNTGGLELFCQFAKRIFVGCRAGAKG